MPALPAKTPETVGIMSKPRSEPAARILPELIGWLGRRGIGVRIDEETARYLGRCDGLPRDQVASAAELVVVLGGDGTLLSAARALEGRDIPVFAVNLGSLGFLTAIKIHELYPQLERAFRGESVLSRRRMLHTELWRAGARMGGYDSLNDITLAKVEIARMIDLELHVDAHFMCVYKADGIIVSTPTGSTAYSLSAGGPIILPSVEALCITPICPHMLSHRPVIVPDHSVIEVRLLGEDNSTYLTIDGQRGELLKHGDRVVCRRSQHVVSLIQPPDLMFFDVLREKLKWGGR
jgi:NAD+ kinase